jgi:manganese/zinc/iron transport system permease protein
MCAVAAAAGAAAPRGGDRLADPLDASIAGSMAAVAGLLFAAAWALAPGRGLVSAARRRARQRVEFAQTMLAIHLANHERGAEAAVENRVEHLGEHLRWSPDFAGRVVHGAERRGLVVRSDGSLLLTERGRAVARDAVAA